MAEIKLKHAAVIDQLNKVRSKLEAVVIPAPPSVGANQMDYTSAWTEREEAIHQMVNQYKEIVSKNLEDTKANVDLLKDQDEAMVRN
ncbi:hypothetical protein JOC78_000412 [Bacillus ectoiniformans]|uniref:YwqI/YxiC family protein n=1 Tax=Bacillus ectoiniformans TaxID=1494429 RepID=UPI00195E99F4|nr:YwqI/YxiC family protein [Bacillus ectoiniformans]MBM7647491.1 hypothetical protein [Bacillus ectoiniformans]